MQLQLELLKRILTRSGELVFDPVQDAVSKDQTDPRSEWINQFFYNGVVGRSVVEIGCWTGITLRDLARFGATRCVGLDLNGPWLTEAQRAFPNGEFIAISSLDEIPSKLLHTFDIALLLETLEHLPKGTELSAFKQLASLLNPTGVAIVSTPAEGLSRITDPAWALTGHRHYSARRLQSLMYEAGLQPTYLGYSGNLRSLLNTINHYLAKYFPILTRQQADNKNLVNSTFRVTTGRSPFAQSIWIVATPITM